jgi:uncharacterized membrane protein YeaQ/YmgE (transglycosylase-associated protein family)
VLFDAIFLTAFFLTWALLGGLVWLVWSIRRDAVGAIWAFPFGPIGGMGGGVLLPLVGVDDGLGLGLSMVMALIGAALLTGMAYRVWDDYDLGDRFANLAQPRFAPSDADPPSDEDRPAIDSESVEADQDQSYPEES